MTIPLQSIIIGDRARSIYDGIEELAQSILDRGLIEPVVLEALGDGSYLLLAGGRRFKAIQSLGLTELHEGLSSTPGAAGYVLANPAHVDAESGDREMIELIENLHRKEMLWQDSVKLIAKAWRKLRRSCAERNEKCFHHTLGAILGLARCEITYALTIADEVEATPEKFVECATVYQAYALKIKETQAAAEKLLAERAIQQMSTPNIPFDLLAEVGLGVSENAVDAVPAPSITIPFTSQFRLGNSLDWMEFSTMVFDHIVCDPDFAIDHDTLDVKGSGNYETGIAQSSVESSLNDLRRLIRTAFVRCSGYFIFFYDLNHHNWLQDECVEAGWLVQRWPITWHKTDHGANGAPQHNFTKDVEWAMVCRHPSSTLAKAAPKSVYAGPSGNASKTFGHPFAKPAGVWSHIYNAIATKGQTVFDPFMGRGSSVIAALRLGLVPHGMELQEPHFNGAVLNIQAEYKSLFGSNVQFA